MLPAPFPAQFVPLPGAHALAVSATSGIGDAVTANRWRALLALPGVATAVGLPSALVTGVPALPMVPHSGMDVAAEGQQPLKVSGGTMAVRGEELHSAGLPCARACLAGLALPAAGNVRKQGFPSASRVTAKHVPLAEATAVKTGKRRDCSTLGERACWSMRHAIVLRDDNTVEVTLRVASALPPSTPARSIRAAATARRRPILPASGGRGHVVKEAQIIHNWRWMGCQTT